MEAKTINSLGLAAKRYFSVDEVCALLGVRLVDLRHYEANQNKGVKKRLVQRKTYQRSEVYQLIARKGMMQSDGFSSDFSAKDTRDEIAGILQKIDVTLAKLHN